MCFSSCVLESGWVCSLRRPSCIYVLTFRWKRRQWDKESRLRYCISRRVSRDNKDTSRQLWLFQLLDAIWLSGKVIVFLLINGHCLQRISWSTRRPFIPTWAPISIAIYLQALHLDCSFQPYRKDYSQTIMPGQHEIGQSYLDTPRSPVSISKDSSRRGSSSPKQVFLEKHSEQPVIHSPQPRLTRKRAASLNIDNANEPRISDPALSSGSTDGPPSSSSSTREPREQVCLCQPDPKIPRPRNGAWSLPLISIL